MLKNILSGFLLSIAILSGTAASQSVPFRSAQGLIVIEASANGAPVTFVMDTGASSSLISYKVAGLGKYKLPKMENTSTSGGGGFSGQAFAVKADISVAGVTVNHLAVYAGNVDDLSARLGFHCDGLLGEDVLRHFKSVRIDYKKHVIEFEQ